MFRNAISSLAVLALSAAVPSMFAQGETPATSRIDSIDLFKNGIAVVTRSIDVDKPGRYLVDASIRPVNGTFWITSGQEVSVCGETRLVDVPNSAPFSNLQATLVGHEVTLYLREGSGNQIVKGKVIDAVPPNTERYWSRDYAQSDSYTKEKQSPRWSYGGGGLSNDFIVLKKADGGILMVKGYSVYSVESDALNQTVKKERPVLLFDVKGSPKGRISCTYLAKGISWAPAYRLRIQDSSKAAITLSATIRNELEDFKDAEVGILSGYPSVAGANVTSPLCADTTWAKFFQEVMASISEDGASKGLRNKIAYQVAGLPGPAATLPPEFQARMSESADIVRSPLGKLSLKEGGAVWMELASASAGYERVVECVIEDFRDPLAGRVVRRCDDPDGGAVIWDAIRFKNPFKFPMTTAPVDISDSSSFLGQAICSWSDPGAETILRITKALSITAKNVEHDLDTQRTVVYIGNNSFMKTVVQGSMSVRNARSIPVKMTAKLQFSGDLVTAEGNPKVALREGGAYSVNKRNEAIWEISLKPGEEQSFKYTYNVLVNR